VATPPTDRDASASPRSGNRDASPPTAPPRPTTVLRWAVSTGYWIFFLLTFPVQFLLVCLVWLAALPFDPRRRVTHMAMCCAARFYIEVAPFWTLRMDGRERLPWNGPAIFASNHLSNLDILALFAVLRPFRWVSKTVVFRVPIVGWEMRLARYIPLERGDRKSILEMFRLCQRSLEEGVPVFLFPEGTRSRDGELQAFKDGTFSLAIQTGAPIYPIAIWGTHTALPKHGVLLYPAHIRIRTLEPVDPKRFDGDVAALREAVRGRIAVGIAALRAEEEAERRRHLEDPLH